MSPARRLGWIACVRTWSTPLNGSCRSTPSSVRVLCPAEVPAAFRASESALVRERAALGPAASVSFSGSAGFRLRGPCSACGLAARFSPRPALGVSRPAASVLAPVPGLRGAAFAVLVAGAPGPGPGAAAVAARGCQRAPAPSGSAHLRSPWHPRVRGGGCFGFCDPKLWPGSSPRARGDRQRSLAADRATAAYPRASGALPADFRHCFREDGLSTPVRGRLFHRPRRSGTPRCLPACAGRLSMAFLSHGPDSVHPRARGAVVYRSCSSHGASPPSRGGLSADSAAGNRGGFISA